METLQWQRFIKKVASNWTASIFKQNRWSFIKAFLRNRWMPVNLLKCCYFGCGGYRGVFVRVALLYGMTLLVWIRDGSSGADKWTVGKIKPRACQLWTRKINLIEKMNEKEEMERMRNERTERIWREEIHGTNKAGPIIVKDIDRKRRKRRVNSEMKMTNSFTRKILPDSASSCGVMWGPATYTE